MPKLNITDKDINIVVDNIKEYIKHIEKLTNIIWKIIPNYEDYIISEYGDIINIRCKKILQLYINKFGYYQINLYKDTIKKTFRIHRLVYSAFLDKDIKEFSIHHRDENKLNNHYSNLQKMTKSKHTKYHHNLESEEYLNQYKKYYDSKYKENLSTKEISKKYNVSKTTVISGIQKYKVYLSNNENINKYNSFNTKEKIQLRKNITEIERKKYLKDYLKKAKEIYNRKNKKHLTDKQLAKIYNLPKTSIENRCQDINIFTKILNSDFNKFYNLSKKEKEKLRKNITEMERKKYLKKYLEKCEEIYNRKNKENLSYKELSRIYNTSENSIRSMSKDRKNFIFILDRDFDKFYNLTSKEKRNLRKNITEMERKEHVKKYLEKAEKIYNRKNKENLFNKELSKIYNIPESTIACYIQEIKFYIFLLDRNFDKFYNLSGKEKLKLRNKIVTIDRRNNNILDIGKQIEDLKLSGVSNKDIANKLNLSINRISDIYKKYKKLINDKEIKNELKSIKKYN